MPGDAARGGAQPDPVLACPAAISEVSLRRWRHFVAIFIWVLEVLVRGLWWLLTKRGRRCQDKNGTFTVETTAWEGPEAATPMVGKAGVHIAATLDSQLKRSEPEHAPTPADPAGS